MLSYTTFQPNSTIPSDSRPHERTLPAIEGEVELTIGEEIRPCRKGDAFTVPGSMEHSITSGGKVAIVVDTLSPPHEEYG